MSAWRQKTGAPCNIVLVFPSDDIVKSLTWDCKVGQFLAFYASIKPTLATFLLYFPDHVVGECSWKVFQNFHVDIQSLQLQVGVAYRAFFILHLWTVLQQRPLDGVQNVTLRALWRRYGKVKISKDMIWQSKDIFSCVVSSLVVSVSSLCVSFHLISLCHSMRLLSRLFHLLSRLISRQKIDHTWTSNPCRLHWRTRRRNLWWTHCWSDDESMGKPKGASCCAILQHILLHHKKS